MGLGLTGSLIVGGLAGWVASSAMGARTGLLLNVVLGIVGAVVANAVLQYIGIYAERTWLPQLVVGAVGASLLIGIARMLRG